MATLASIGYGSSYAIWDSTLTTPAFVTLAEVISITPGESETDRIEATHMASPGRRREYIAGLVDSGEASIELNWIPGNATDLLLRRLQADGEVTQHRITINDSGVTLTYDGAITGYSKSMPVDDRLTATVTVALSGAETWGVAA
jgi:predicted secreted protein